MDPWCSATVFKCNLIVTHHDWLAEAYFYNFVWRNVYGVVCRVCACYCGCGVRNQPWSNIHITIDLINRVIIRTPPVISGIYLSLIKVVSFTVNISTIICNISNYSAVSQSHISSIVDSTTKTTTCGINPC